MWYLILAVVFVVNTIIMVNISQRLLVNPIRARCPACNSKLHQYPPGKWEYITQIVWQIVAWSVVWRLEPPFIVGVLLVFVLALPAMRAINRTYYAIWMYWHPLRCGEGGHTVPVPTKA